MRPEALAQRCRSIGIEGARYHSGCDVRLSREAWPRRYSDGANVFTITEYG